jgi:hypothetical protein
MKPPKITIPCPKCGQALDARKMVALAGAEFVKLRRVKSGGSNDGRPPVYTHGPECPCARCRKKRGGMRGGQIGGKRSLETLSQEARIERARRAGVASGAAEGGQEAEE